MRTSRRAPFGAAVIGFLLHTLAVLWVWWTWGLFGRGNVLSWLDFPVSLTYMHLDGEPLLFSSLVGGGLQWALIAALATSLLGLAARRRAG